MDNLHNKQIGTIGELCVSNYLMRKGFPVFKELGDLSRVDLITIINNTPVKVQVKTFRGTEGIDFTCAKNGPNYRYTYQEDDVDVFALYLVDIDKVIFLTWSDIPESKFLKIRITPPKNNQRKGIHMYEDYLELKINGIVV